MSKADGGKEKLVELGGNGRGEVVDSLWRALSAIFNRIPVLPISVVSTMFSELRRYVEKALGRNFKCTC